jgi:hypothetical protein
MKKATLILSVLLATTYSSLAQTPHNCSEILALTPAAASGVYTVDPDGAGALPSMSCQCDMTTDGGGWTLVLNYNHLTGTSPALHVFTDSLPLQDRTTLGFDESNTEFWGHADTALMNALAYDEVRFYGATSGHSRIIDFKTLHTGTVEYFKRGLGSTEGISSDFTALAGHTAFLPAAINMTTYDKGNFAMTDYPLWTGSTYHWYLGGYDSFCSYTRWEVDDYPCSSMPSTFHQIWVRQSNSTGLNDAGAFEKQLTLSPNPADQLLVISYQLPENGKGELNIYTATGQLVHSETVCGNQQQITVGDLSSGVYAIELKTKDFTESRKLILQH